MIYSLSRWSVIYSHAKGSDLGQDCVTCKCHHPLKVESVGRLQRATIPIISKNKRSLSNV